MPIEDVKKKDLVAKGIKYPQSPLQPPRHSHPKPRTGLYQILRGRGVKSKHVFAKSESANFCHSGVPSRSRKPSARWSS